MFFGGPCTSKKLGSRVWGPRAQLWTPDGARFQREVMPCVCMCMCVGAGAGMGVAVGWVWVWVWVHIRSDVCASNGCSMLIRLPPPPVLCIMREVQRARRFVTSPILLLCLPGAPRRLTSLTTSLATSSVARHV